MSKMLVINPEKCAGCHTCELMCSFEHTKTFNPRLSAVTVIEYEGALTSVPIMCMQCDEACCLKVCPVEAITRDEKGAVVMNPDKCIVCKMCVSACPLGNISYSPCTKSVFKCDLCGGDPKCAKFCAPGAIKLVDPTENPDRKKAVAGHLKDVYGLEVAP
jgi:Fe-S-cluster-containing hydrogenase component 2